MTQPEPSLDPPIPLVDHLELAQVMLRDAEHELRQAEIGKQPRAMIGVLIELLQEQIEALR